MTHPYRCVESSTRSQGVTLTPGIPVVPMLAKHQVCPEVLKVLNGSSLHANTNTMANEPKFTKFPDGSTRVFSRNLLDTSEKHPEVPMLSRSLWHSPCF
jgi:DNA ligase-1